MVCGDSGTNSEYQGIPLRNVYYMLQYCLNNINALKLGDASTENFESVGDILAFLLIKSVEEYNRLGGTRGYNSYTIDTNKPRGQINFVKSRLNSNGGKTSLVCNYMQLDNNDEVKQLLKYAIRLLLLSSRYTDIKKEYKLELQRLQQELIGIPDKIYTSTEIDKIIIGNNIPYQATQVVYSSIVVIKQMGYSDSRSGTRLYRLPDDYKLNTIFEYFIRGVFKEKSRELNIGYVKKRKFDEGMTNVDCMIGTTDNHFVVIDCKWYNKSKAGMSNIAQVNWYIDKAREDIKHRLDKSLHNIIPDLANVGIVLYAESPRINKSTFRMNDYSADGKKIYNITLNMNQQFEDIKIDLIDIYKKIYSLSYSN